MRKKVNASLAILSGGAVLTMISLLKRKNQEIQWLRSLNSGLQKKHKEDLIFIQILAHLIFAIWDNGDLKKVLDDRGYHNVAVYGYGRLGEIVVLALQKAGVDITFIIDQNTELKYGNIPFYCPQQILPEVDVVIVTTIYYFDEVKETLIKNNIKADILPIDNILYQM